MLIRATMEHSKSIGKLLPDSQLGNESDALYADMLERSILAYTVMGKEKPLAIVGFISNSYFNPTCYIWAALSADVERHKIQIARESKRVIEEAKKQYSTIYATSKPGYALAKKWLAWLGFKQIPAPFTELDAHLLEAS